MPHYIPHFCRCPSPHVDHADYDKGPSLFPILCHPFRALPANRSPWLPLWLVATVFLLVLSSLSLSLYASLGEPKIIDALVCMHAREKQKKKKRRRKSDCARGGGRRFRWFNDSFCARMHSRTQPFPGGSVRARSPRSWSAGVIAPLPLARSESGERERRARSRQVPI